MKLFTLSLRAFTLLLLMSTAWPLTGRGQAWQWASQAISPSTSAYTYSRVLFSKLDGAGNTVVAGQFNGTLTLGATTLVSTASNYTEHDLFVARISPTGQWLQAVRAGGSHDTPVTGIAVDGAGNVVVVGTFGGTNNNAATIGATAVFGNITLTSTSPRDLFVARLSAAGVWTQALRLSSSLDIATGPVVIDANGNAVVTGNFTGTLAIGGTTLTSGPAGDIFVARLSPADQWIQATQAADATTTGVSYAQVATLDATGNLVIAGLYSGTVHFGPTAPLTNTTLGRMPFVARLSPTGQWVQAVQVSSTAVQLNCLTMDGTGNVVIGGSITGTVSFGNIALTSVGQADIFVARLNPAGTWTQAVLASGPGQNFAFALAADGTGNVVVAGLFGLFVTPGASLGGGQPVSFGNTLLTNAGLGDIFVAQLSPTGQWLWAKAAGGTLIDGAYSLTVAPDGAITVAGNFSGAASFGPLSVSSPNTTGTALVARLSSSALAARAAAPAEVFTLAPNPATTQVRLSWPEASATARPVQVLDGLGREVRRLELPARATAAALDVQGLAPGLYLVRCGAATGRLVVE